MQQDRREQDRSALMCVAHTPIRSVTQADRFLCSAAALTALFRPTTLTVVSAVFLLAGVLVTKVGYVFILSDTIVVTVNKVVCPHLEARSYVSQYH